MGMYLNPPKSIFSQYLNDDIFVDKSDIFRHLNAWCTTSRRYICLTRPRRFGKSMMTDMIAAYYGLDHDSHDIFDGLKVAKIDAYAQYINRYAVVSFDAQSFRDNVENPLDFVPSIHKRIGSEFRARWPEWTDSTMTLPRMMQEVYAHTGTQFVVLIDEWDSIFRRDKNNTAACKAWIQFLRSMFKSAEARSYLALAYITGILPIKKYDVESSLNVFSEYTILDTHPLEPYFGFTEEEVAALCAQYQMNLNEIMRWYDGYRLSSDISMYNPKAVVEALARKRCSVYWTQTGAFDVVMDYVNMNFDGLHDAISQMLMGDRIPVKTGGFNTSLELRDRDDVLTALIHLGYLTFDWETKTAWIPNEEVRNVLEDAVTKSGWKNVMENIRRSRDFMDAIECGDTREAASLLESIHDALSVPLHYHSEGDLTATLLHACYVARENYLFYRELPSSRGYADLILAPTMVHAHRPIIFELKLDTSTDSAIRQILQRRYFDTPVLKNYHGDVLTVAMMYDRKDKQHRCAIETMTI